MATEPSSAKSAAQNRLPDCKPQTPTKRSVSTPDTTIGATVTSLVPFTSGSATVKT